MDDRTTSLFNAGYAIQFYHIPSKRSVEFKAFLTEFSDDYASNWEPEVVFGRNDPLYNFKNTSRSISLGWSLVAASATESRSNLQKMSLLIRMLYPSYDAETHSDFNGVINAASIVASPLFRVKFLNLIQDVSASSPDDGSDLSATAKASISGLVGKINSISNKPNLEAGFLTQSKRLYPKEINLSCTIDVIHTHPLGWAEESFRQGGFPYGDAGPVRLAMGNEIAGEDFLIEEYDMLPEELGPANFFMRNTLMRNY